MHSHEYLGGHDIREEHVYKTIQVVEEICNLGFGVKFGWLSRFWGYVLVVRVVEESGTSWLTANGDAMMPLTTMNFSLVTTVYMPLSSTMLTATIGDTPSVV